MTRIQLTDSQRLVLAAAAERPDGAVEPLPHHIRGGAATKIIHALLKAGLISDMPFILTTAGRDAISPPKEEDAPTIPVGLEKLTVAQIATAMTTLTGEPVSAKSFNYKEKALTRLASAMSERNLSLRDVLAAAGVEVLTPSGQAISGLGLAPDPAPTKPRATGGTKQDALIAMLKRPEGASIAEIMEATGWLAHTCRGAIAGALKKKLGLEVTSEKVEGRGRTYKVQA